MIAQRWTMKQRRPNSNDNTTVDDEAKTDQQRSENGIRNANRSRPSRKKEDGPEAKTKGRRNRVKATKGAPLETKDNLTKRKKEMII